MKDNLTNMITKEKKIHKGIITSINNVAEDMFYMSFEIPYDMNIKPGQFVSILCEGLILRRPFSVFTYNNRNVGVLIKQIGKGTKYLNSLKIGDTIDFIGALGNSFTIENKKSLLIGAGVGIAPVFYLKEVLDKMGIDSLAVAGFLNEKFVPKGLKIDEIVTDDGSIGKKGRVVDYFDEFVEQYKPEKIYSCGPMPVLKAVAELGEKYNIPTEIAMEKVMACGIGVCRGCVIKRKNGKMASVCQDGPVFKGDELLWQ